MKKIIYLVTSLTLWSCVSKPEYDEIKTENELLKTKITVLESELSGVRLKYNQLLKEKKQAEIEKSKIPYVTEEKAMEYIVDNYSFYEKDIKYRNVELRRSKKNIFLVSLQECPRGFGYGEAFWISRVRTLTVYGDSEYIYK